MKITEISKIDIITSLSFSHNRDGVDVYGWNSEMQIVFTKTNCDSDLFLEFFYYGTTIYDPSSPGCSDLRETMVEFLKKVI